MGCWWIREEACKKAFKCDKKPIIIGPKKWSKLVLSKGGQIHYWKNGCAFSEKQILYAGKLYQLKEK